MGIEDQQVHRSEFGSEFKWGITTAAFQVEGSCGADGKGASVWDVFTEKKGKIKDGHKASTACDFYNHYQKDIALIRRLHIPNFRFSISWPRVMPTGMKPVNQKGIDFYNRVIDHCLENDVTPWLTLYHWDLPQALEERSGWTNREVVSWFSDYAEVCAKHFGDRVKNWLVLNEPMVFTGAGYFLGIHAPGRTGLKNFFPAVHHVVLSMAEGGRILKSLVPDAEVGTSFSCSHIDPYSDREKDIKAARRADALLNRLFVEPVLGLGYPVQDVPILKGLQKYIKPGDEEKMKFDFDFIGLQNYTREIVRYSLLTPYIHARLVKAEKRQVPLTSMNWEVYPPAIYHVLKKFNAYPQIRKLYITENGAAFPDRVTDGLVDDPQRLQYIQDNIAQVYKARQEGCKVDGYFIWTLTDNFEWAEGYHPRFGIIYVDYATQKRIIKSSGKWYGRFLSGQVGSAKPLEHALNVKL